VKKILIFGAGNIGRSLVGQLFSEAGYEVVFVDVVDAVVNALNKNKRYKIIVKDIDEEIIWVENVQAINGMDKDKVVSELALVDIVATAVGQNNLRNIYGIISEGLKRRYRLGKGPIDIIICENVRNASKIFKVGLQKHLPKDYPLDSLVGLVETSIGKMVPIVTKEHMIEDPLTIYAEAYNKIIMAKKAFKNEIPIVKGIEAKENINPYVDRKIFIHNMGHSATAYLSYITDPDMHYIWQAIRNKNIKRSVIAAMWESARSLIILYPCEFNEESMKKYIENLIQRFDNKMLGDTVYRVGRDLHRKLSRNDNKCTISFFNVYCCSCNIF
jgi:mannitol-1-phosphate 5-dehydrogenase